MAPVFRINESEHFQKQIKQLVEVFKVDEATLNDVLLGVKWALENKPDVNPIVDGTDDLRIIKTNRRDRGTASVPMLRFLYRIDDDSSVTLLTADTMDLFL